MYVHAGIHVDTFNQKTYTAKKCILHHILGFTLEVPTGLVVSKFVI